MRRGALGAFVTTNKSLVQPRGLPVAEHAQAQVERVEIFAAPRG